MSLFFVCFFIEDFRSDDRIWTYFFSHFKNFVIGYIIASDDLGSCEQNTQTILILSVI